MSNPQKSRWTCMADGCTRSVQNGHAIHRTSPKGDLFAGLCTEHHSNPEPLAMAIEERNQRAALSAPPEETT